MQCPTCSEFFPCRFCHDAAKDEGEPNVKKRHTIDRHAVTHMRCRACATVQPKAQSCGNCKAVLGNYYCDVCSFWDHDGPTKQTYHCAGCGICRVGPPEAYRHCDKCNACFPARGSHLCRSNSLKEDCPVCLTDMHHSRDPAVPLPCGHAMHSTCHSGMLKSGQYKCPLCSKSMVDMSRQWRLWDVEHALTVVPEQYASQWFRVLCNDCGCESDAPFSVVGFKCRAEKKSRAEEASVCCRCSCCRRCRV